MSRPYPCVYCTEDGHCKKSEDEEVTSWCIQGPCEDKEPEGIAIRKMIIEAMARAWDIQEAKEKENGNG